MFTEQNAYDAVMKIAKTKGNVRAGLIERIYRHETGHFTSGQYVKTGSAGMERGRWPKISKNIPYVTLKDNKTNKIVEFIVWQDTYDFCIYLSDYIDRHGGNWARWNSANYLRQRDYTGLVNNVRNKWIKGGNPYLNNNYTSSNGTSGSDPQVYSPPPPIDKTIICKKDQTIQEFIDDNNILMSVSELTLYLTNSLSIYKHYNQQQKVKYIKASEELITTGTKILIPMYQISVPKSIYNINQTIVENSKYNAFVEKEVKKLLNNVNYKKINISQDDLDGSKEYGTLHKKDNNVSVWVWTKSTDYDKGSHLIDITPFIIDITTNVGDNGGNFSFSLPHMTFDELKNDSNRQFNLPLDWILDDNFESFVTKQTIHNVVDFNSSDIKCDFKDDNDELKSNSQVLLRKSSLFNSILQKNDVVFIRFERLIADKVYSNFTSNELFRISPSDLPNNVYDMIGLIDNVSISSQSDQSEQIVSVDGRDLSKLLIDDSIYNFIVGFGVQSKEQILQNSNKNKSTGRVVMEVNKQEFNVGGGIAQDNDFNFFQTHSIDEWIVFLFSQLTNTSITPDNLFNSYKDRSMITSRQISSNSGGFEYKKTLASGIWQIVKLCFDSETTKRRLADDSLSTNTGSLINMVRKYAQKPFVELNMDTYGDKYYFTFRKPPFTYESFKTNPCINIFEGDVIQDNLDFESEYYSMYQLDALGSLIESTDGQNLIVLQAILLPEFVEFFGLRNLHVSSNYLDFDMSVSNLTEANLQHLIDQHQEDLGWLIESNCYLPFTRKGSITIKGDRRIKRGMNIRHFGTGEVYYVDSVSNTASFSNTSDRSTTLQVSRGMVEKDIEKYFNITNREKIGGKINWNVNRDIFKYLMQKRQFR